MMETGLLLAFLLPKQVRSPIPLLEGSTVPRWLVILAVIAAIATIAGFLVFGGANMGH